MRAIYDVCAPAKLNLFLHVTGRRADGYHLLQSVFMFVDWCDFLNLDLRQDGLISREDLLVQLPPDDLIVQAARALQRATGTHLGAHIAVEKHIPSQAGMGGGSSDAASALLALNRLWNTRLTLPQLSEIGLSLGADVPFFLNGHNAWVEGIGEKIEPVDLPPASFVVVKPAQGLETARIFSSSELKRDSETAILYGFAEDPYGFGRNDLQDIAVKLCPEVGSALEWLGLQGLAGRMTGSGSAVFSKLVPAGAPGNSGGNAALAGWNRAGEAKVDDVLEPALLKAPSGFEVRVCRNLQAHPLKGWAR